KMSKSKGNIVEPLPLVEQYGADTLRLYVLFLGPPDQDAEWQDTGIGGTRRFVDRLWRLVHTVARDAGAEGGIVAWPNVAQCQADDVARELAAAAHAAIRKVGEDIDPRFQFNTAIAALMELVNVGTRLLVGTDDVLGSDAPDVRRRAARGLAQA